MAKLIRQLNVKLSTEEFERLRRIGKNTGLPLSNICRRSTIEMLAKFERTKFPGTPSRAQEEKESR